MEKKLFLLSVGILFITSCSNDGAENFTDTTFSTTNDDITIIDSGTNVSILKETPSVNDHMVNVSDFAFRNDNAVQLRSSQMGGPFTMVGYTNRKYIKSDKIYFAGSNPWNLIGAYLFDLYEYYYQVTIPHGATLSIPPTPTNPKNMGCKELNNFIAGYTVIAGAKNNNGDTYYLRTYVRIITHNVLGQQVGPYYYPYEHPDHSPTHSAIKDPNTFIFKYAWSMIEW